MPEIFKNKKRGYAMLELLFYISIFAIISLVSINAMVIMTKSFRETAIQGEFVESASIMERISREIRGSYGINFISGTDLVLNTKDVAGANKTEEFVLSGHDIRFLENGTLTGNLNTPNIYVTALTFTQITTTTGKAVKVVLTVKSTNDALGRTENFYDTIVLRDSY
ncbi:MAG: type II secretion system protein [Candidatus Paceibacterota bacterium]